MNNIETYNNIIAPFTLNDQTFRGRIVKLSSSLNEAVYKHSYPYHISKLLCEVLIAASMIGDNLKHGILTLQVKSEGIVKVIVADYFEGGKIRGYVSFDKEAYENIKDTNPTFEDLIGKGYMAITLDQGPDTDLYQGIVEIEGKNLDDCLNAYFKQSEQIDTCFKIMVGQEMYQDGFEKWCGGGIMVQKLPNSELDNMSNEDDWDRIKIFIETVQADELIDRLIEPNTLLNRLFHEDKVMVYDHKHVIHGCRCSRERASNIVKSIPKDELTELAINEEIEVKCEFCGSKEVFNIKDID